MSAFTGTASPTTKQRLIWDTANRGECWGSSPVSIRGFRWPLLGPRALEDGCQGVTPAEGVGAGSGFCRIQIPGNFGGGAQVGPDPGRVDAAPWIHRASCPGPSEWPALV